MPEAIQKHDKNGLLKDLTTGKTLYLYLPLLVLKNRPLQNSLPN